MTKTCDNRRSLWNVTLRRRPATLLHGCCTRPRQRSRASIHNLLFTCKNRDSRSGPDETRTRDLCHAKAALSQLSYGPEEDAQSLAPPLSAFSRSAVRHRSSTGRLPACAASERAARREPTARTSVVQDGVGNTGRARVHEVVKGVGGYLLHPLLPEGRGDAQGWQQCLTGRGFRHPERQL